MVVYVEDAILQNLIVDYLLLKMTFIALNEKASKLKMFLATFCGTALSIVLTFFVLPKIVALIVKLICAFAISSVAVKDFSIKKVLLFCSIFVFATFLMGGLCLALQNCFNAKFLPYVVLPLMLVSLYFFKNVAKQLYKKKKLSNYNFDLIVTHNNKSSEVLAYLDSGNLVQEVKSGLPILIVNFATFEKIFSEINIVDFVSGNLNKKIDGHYENFSSVASGGKMFVCRADKVLLKENNKFRNIDVLLGVSSFQTNFNGFDALLSPLAL